MGVIPTILAIDTVLWLGFTVILTGAQIRLGDKDNYQVLRGNEFSAFCFVASNVTFSQYHWYFTQEGSVKRNLTNSTRYALTTNRDRNYVTIQLSLKNVTFSDTGIYTCEVTSPNGADRKNLSLTVYDKPTVTVFESNYNIEIGNNLTVNCSIDGNGSTVTNVNWRKEPNPSSKYVQPSKRIFFNSSSPSLIINNVSLDDAGNYTCIGQTTFGITESSQIRVQIFYKPTVTVFESNYNIGIGNNLTVNCSIDGNGSTVTNVIWRKETNTSSNYVHPSKRIFFNSSRPSLIINNVTLDDAGNYTCIGETAFGTEKSSQISVQIFSKPDIIVPAYEYRSQNGTAVSLQIKVQTRTSLSIKWEKFKEENQQWVPFQNNSRLSWTYFNPSLNISTALVEDDGKYRISVKTDFHEFTSPSILLTVYVPVKIKEMGTNPAVIHEGDQVEIRCLADGRPEPKVTWTFANGTMNSLGHAQGNSLLLERVTHLNEGNYTCKAQNNFSDDQSLIFLTVIPVFTRQGTDLTGSPFENYLIPSVSVFVSVALISLIVVIILIRRKRHPVRTENVSNSKPKRKSNGHKQHSPSENIRRENDHAKFYVNISGDTTYAQVIRKSNKNIAGNIGIANNISASNTRIRESNHETGTSQVHMNIDNTYAAVQKPSLTTNADSNIHEETESEDTQLNGPEELKYIELDFSTNTLGEENRIDFIRGEPSTTTYADVVFPR